MSVLRTYYVHMYVRCSVRIPGGSGLEAGSLERVYWEEVKRERVTRESAQGTRSGYKWRCKSQRA